MEFKSIEQAKSALQASHRVMESNLGDVDCGIALLCHIRPKVSEAARVWNAGIDWLIANDPQCPKGLENQKVNLG